MDWRDKRIDELTLEDAQKWREYAREQLADSRLRRDDAVRDVRSNRAWERSAAAHMRRLRTEGQGDGH